MEDGGFHSDHAPATTRLNKKRTSAPKLSSPVSRSRRFTGFGASENICSAVATGSRPTRSRRPVDLDLERIAFGSIVGVTGATVAARTGREPNQQINLGKKR